MFRDGLQGYPIVALANQYGSAEVSLFGAQVLSYKPTGNFPVLLTRQIMAAFRSVGHGLERMDRRGPMGMVLRGVAFGVLREVNILRI